MLFESLQTTCHSGTPTYTMSYSPQVISAVKKAPKTLGNQLGRWAVHHDFSAIKIAKVTGASRQSVYNWFNGGEVFVAYRPSVEAILKILQASSTGDEAWRRTCKAFNLKT
jgi:hypothetical protein